MHQSCFEDGNLLRVADLLIKPTLSKGDCEFVAHGDNNHAKGSKHCLQGRRGGTERTHVCESGACVTFL